MGKFKTYDELLDLFPDKPRMKIQNGFNVVCPAHNDRNPSLSVTLNGDKILMNDKAGCTTEAVCKALGITTADLFLNDTKKGLGEPLAQYHYHNPDGTTRYTIKRYDAKKFLAYMPNSTTPGIGDTEKILYHAPDIVKAIKNGSQTFVVEGEKDADKLISIAKVNATTPPFGCESQWLPQYTEILKGGHVVVMPDTDTPGLKKGYQIANALYKHVKSLKLVELEGAKDISDWLSNGGTVEGLLEMVDETPEYAPESEKPPVISSLGETYQFTWDTKHIYAEVINVYENTSGLSGEVRIIDSETRSKYLSSRLNFLSDTTKDKICKILKGKRDDVDWTLVIDAIGDYIINDFRTGNPVQTKEQLKVIPDDPYLVYPIIYTRQPTIFYGYGESYKTTEAMGIAILTQNGIDQLGYEPKKANVLWLDFENDDTNFNTKATAMQEGFSLGVLEFPLYKDCRNKTLAQLSFEIRKQVMANNIELVIVDSLTMAAGGYDHEQTIAYFAVLSSLNTASLTLDHRAKGMDKGSSPIGSVVKTNIARNVFEITSTYIQGTNYGSLIIKNTKNNSDMKAGDKYERIEFEKTGRKLTKITFVGLDPFTIGGDKTSEKPQVRQALINYFKDTDNAFATPTQIEPHANIPADTIGVTLRRGESYFEGKNGTYRIKEELYDMLTNT